MIKTKNGKVKGKGSDAELMADLSVIIKSLSTVMSREGIMRAVELGFKTDEELDEEIKTLASQLELIIEEKTSQML